MSDTCANCGRPLLPGMTTGDSSIYGSSDRHQLCEPCFFEEEEVIDEKGTNNLPDRLAQYNENLKARYYG